MYCTEIIDLKMNDAISQTRTVSVTTSKKKKKKMSTETMTKLNLAKTELLIN